MSKFKKNGGASAPALNTASLPDIVFMLLFFFMVATTSKETDPTVETEATNGTQSTDLTPYKQRSEIDFLYLGTPRNPNRASEEVFMLSLDNVPGAIYEKDGLYKVDKVAAWKEAKKSNKPPRMTAPIEEVITCIKADKNAPSGLIFDIRDQLKSKKAFTIAYSVRDNGNF